MKNVYLTIASMFISALACAQQPFCPAGAVWHYNFTSPSGYHYGFSQINYSGDTVIAGIQCKKLESVYYTFVQPDSLIYTSYYPDQYIYQNGDTVFRYQNGYFVTWFNFGAQTGDQWVIDNSGTSMVCDSLSRVKVTGTSSVTIHGQALRRLAVDTVGLSPYGYHEFILERIGPVNDNHLFPLGQNCDSTIIVDFYITSFACYEDSAFGLYNATPYPCGYWLYLGLDKNEMGSLDISPNPSSGTLIIHSGRSYGRTILTIYNLLGDAVYAGSVSGTQTELTLQVESGVYIAELNNGVGSMRQKIIIKK